MNIRPARLGESILLTDLALRSKGYWPYDRNLLEEYRPHLLVSDEDIRSGSVYVGVLSADVVIGFYGLSSGHGLQRLYYLFVEPEYIGQGIGFKLWSHAIEMAQQRGWRSLAFYADLFATEKFYLPLGCYQVGEMESELGGKLFELKFDFPV